MYGGGVQAVGNDPHPRGGGLTGGRFHNYLAKANYFLVEEQWSSRKSPTSCTTSTAP